VECDASIKSIIVNIDSENHDYIIEDLDETHLVIKENMMESLKSKLEDVCPIAPLQILLGMLMAATNLNFCYGSV